MKYVIPLLACMTLLSPSCTPTGNGPDGNDLIVDEEAISRIDSTLNHFVESEELAGLSALIMENGEEVYFGAHGFADRENGVAMNRNSIIQIYSMTKPLVGVALMTLYEEGAFDLDDPLEEYAPEFEGLMVYAGDDADGNPVLVEPVRPVTIRDVTRHTAGFGGPGLPGTVPSNPLARTNTLTEMAEILGSRPLAYHPGERWQYGISVDVQAFLVERLSGRPFAEYLRDQVLDPLGMDETRYFVPEDDRERMAAVYQLSDEDGLVRVPDESAFSANFQEWPLTPGGYGLTSTIDNYMTFAQMLLNGGEYNGVRILEPETVELMATNHLPDSIPLSQRSWLPDRGQVGFGIDFAVRLRPPVDSDENNGVVGEFFWDGALGTLFWVDPVNELTAVLFVQIRPYDPVGLHNSFRDAVYGEFITDTSGEM